MDFGKSYNTFITEEIMSLINPHIIKDPPPQENLHYNKCYEKIHGRLKILCRTIEENSPLVFKE